MLETSSSTRTVLAAAELWRCNADPLAIELDSAFYGGLDALRNASDHADIAAGKGPIGQAVSTGEPRVLTGFSEFGFLYQEAAQAAGLGGAAILPSFEQGRVTSVLVLYFRGGPSTVAAVELWAGTKGRFELSLDQSYYTGLERFARISRYVNFPKGSGLPGVCWDTALPRIVPHVAESKAFLRPVGEQDGGLTVGLGIPIMHRTELRGVFVALSSVNTPFATVHEVWVEDPQQPTQLIRAQGVYGGHVELARATDGMTFATAGQEGLPGQAWAAAQPLLLDGPDAILAAGSSRGDAFRDAGLAFALAIPVVVVDRVRAVVMLMG
ncbi:MAG: hypothetical protein AAGG38_02320 [Planctomycetota bacterium]